MAKRKKVLPARKQRDRSQDDESLLIRSAESLGRMIGSLQRQLDGAAKRLSETADDVMDSIPDIPRVGREDSRRGGTKRKKKKSATRKRAEPQRRFSCTDQPRAADARRQKELQEALTTGLPATRFYNPLAQEDLSVESSGAGGLLCGSRPSPDRREPRSALILSERRGARAWRVRQRRGVSTRRRRSRRAGDLGRARAAGRRAIFAHRRRDAARRPRAQHPRAHLDRDLRDITASARAPAYRSRNCSAPCAVEGMYYPPVPTYDGALSAAPSPPTPPARRPSSTAARADGSRR